MRRFALLIAVVGMLAVAAPSESPAPRCMEDSPCWIPQLDGNGRGKLDMFRPFRDSRI